ncbi:hypothetical protein Y1Q_0017799 [Alligator mississippiensis]|uniref:Uncharacterized protein n=1 Tax=Alligator mississippiensis TaxID=8496 RepID=A0A151MJJ0_ALLMI|nr:hypothetical protein Y1Q_0017799 [Alligator mississippiensis]
MPWTASACKEPCSLDLAQETRIKKSILATGTKQLLLNEGMQVQLQLFPLLLCGTVSSPDMLVPWCWSYSIAGRTSAILHSSSVKWSMAVAWPHCRQQEYGSRPHHVQSERQIMENPDPW